ncbi:hypothetical protein BOX15_Mlig019322g1 [Macrostomum lignano]|uniref:RING-type E3 ubiquitin transferase n=2 Tax=Macrostomum lignano TaxID=282301 RepID=A0A1I8FW83_9PLAT|nr:hypothetical protein BOX15_Mlig019322g1 [Macrostomum lignano]
MSTCARFEVEVQAVDASSAYTAVGLIIGLIIGFLLTFILLWICCFHMKFRSRSYNTCFLAKLYSAGAERSCGAKFNDKMTCLDRRNLGRVEEADPSLRRASATSGSSLRMRSMRNSQSEARNSRRSLVPPTAEVGSGKAGEDGVLGRLWLLQADGQQAAERLAMIDAIAQVTEQEGEQELLQQDWAATARQERDLWRARLLGLWQLTGSLLNRLQADGDIDEDTRRRLLAEHTDQMAGAQARVEEELAAAREERKKRQLSRSSSTDATVVAAEEAEAASEEEAKRSARLDSAAQLEMARLRRRLSGLPKLGAEKADALMAGLKAGVARLEGRLANQRLRQCADMEAALARRRQLLAQQMAADEEATYGIEQLMESRRLQLGGLVRDQKLSDGERQKILAAYQKSLLRQKEAFEKSYLSQKKSLAERLRQARESQAADLERRHAAAVGRLIERVETGTDTGDPERAADALADKLEARDSALATMHEDCDARDCNQLTALRDDLLQEKGSGEAQVEEELNRQLGLSEDEVGRMLDMHRRQVEKFRKDKRSEQQRSQRRLEEKLASRQAKFAAARQAREAELAEVKRGQDVVLHKALALQADIDEQARKQIVEEHERQLLALGNSLQLSRLRQEKGLEAKLAARRAAMSRLQRDTREEKLLLDEQKAGGPEAAKLEARLAARMEEEKRRLYEESRLGRQRLRENLAAETAAALKEQEARLGEAIGRLQTGQARRRGLIDRQEKVVRELEAQLEARLAEDGDGGGRDDGDMRGLDQILQSYRNQMANLSDQMDREKRQQEMLLKERLQRRKLEREEEVKQTVDKEEQEATRALDSSGHGQIARYVLELSLDAKFRNSMMSMEEEMRLEMKRQQEQLDREMEADLQKSLEDQRKRLFGDLARLTSIPKSEMQDMVDRAGTTAGVGRKLTRQVSRDITDGAAAAAEDAGRKKASRAKKQKAKQPRVTREDFDEEEEYRGGSRGRAARPASSKQPKGRQYQDDFEDEDY